MSSPAAIVKKIAAQLCFSRLRFLSSLSGETPAAVIGDRLPAVFFSRGSAAVPAKGLPTSTRHMIAAPVFLHRLLALRARLRVRLQPVCCRRLSRLLVPPAPPHLTSRRRVCIVLTGKAEPLLAGAGHFTGELVSQSSLQPYRKAAVRCRWAPFDGSCAILSYVGFQQSMPEACSCRWLRLLSYGKHLFIIADRSTSKGHAPQAT